MIKKLIAYIFYFVTRALPIHIVNLVMFWFPNDIISNYIRGFLVSPFLGKCGKKFQLGRGVILNHPERLYVGEGCYISHNCYVQANGNVTIGDHSTIGPMCIIASSKHIIEDGKVTNRGISEPINIGSGTWIAGNVTIVSGVSVGDNVIVGGGAVVTHDVPSGSLAVGVPAQVKRRS